MIESYDFGAMAVDGQKYTADLIILPGKIKSDWWRREGHKLALEDLKDVFLEDIEVLVVGTGFYGLMKVGEAVKQAATARGLTLHIEKTEKATRVFNELFSRKKTAGAFHLTC
jgi:hypothetical protein